MNPLTLSTLEPPTPALDEPLLAYEREQLRRLQSAVMAAPERIRLAFINQTEVDHYTWFTPARPLEIV